VPQALFYKARSAQLSLLFEEQIGDRQFELPFLPRQEKFTPKNRNSNFNDEKVGKDLRKTPFL
jgi:hypothetical protein